MPRTQLWQDLNTDTDASIQCQNCGAPLFSGDKFCISSGHPVFDEDEMTLMTNEKSAFGPVAHIYDSPIRFEKHEPPNNESMKEEPVEFCSQCGNPIYPNDLFCTNCSASISVKDDDEPLAHPQLVTITLDEARNGCTKILRLSDGAEVQVDVPAGTNAGTKVDVPQKGDVDKATGRRGPLRLSFFIIR